MTGNCGILRARGGPRAEVLRQDHITGAVGQQTLCGSPAQCHREVLQGWSGLKNLSEPHFNDLWNIIEREPKNFLEKFARVWVSEVITVVVVIYHNLNLWYRFDIFTRELVIYNGSIFRHEITDYVNMISMAFSISALISHQNKLHTKADNTSPLSSNEELEVTRWWRPCSAKAGFSEALVCGIL